MSEDGTPTAHRPEGGVPAYPGMAAFVAQLQRLINQPRRERDWLPVVLMEDPDGTGADSAGSRIAGGLYGWLGGRDAPLARHAYVPHQPSDDPPMALYDTIREQLADTTQHCRQGRLSLPGLWLLATVAQAPEDVRTDLVRPQTLRDHCYARYREEISPFADWLWKMSLDADAPDGTTIPFAPGLGPLWHGLTVSVGQWLPRWWFGMRMESRLSWFTAWSKRQGRVRRGRFRFFRYAQDLVPCAVEATRDVQRCVELDRVLVQALLADLDRAVRRPVWHPWRRRRMTRFVLLFERVGEKESRQQRFLRELRWAAGRQGCTSALVVAAGASSRAERIPDTEVSGFYDAATALRTRPDTSGVVIHVPAEAPDNAAARYQLDWNPRLVPRAPRWSPVTELVMEVAALVVTGLLLTALVVWGPLWDHDPCWGTTFLSRSGECVGPQDPTVVTQEDAVRTVLEDIYEENDRVEEATADWTDEQGFPEPRTVVFLGPLTGGQGAKDPVRGGTLAEMRGLALAQREINDQALAGERVPLRVLVADAGDRYRDAVEVAWHIVDLAGKDSSIVGVVGLGQSRDTVYHAIRVLGAAGLPVVGTAGTADEIIDQSNHYFQTAPTNSRMGAAMAAFAQYGEPVTRAGGERVTAEQALVVTDAADDYSYDLAQSFLGDYAGPEAVLIYEPPGGPPGDRQSLPLPGERQANREELALSVCEALREEPATVVVWTGRGSEIPLFLTEFARVSDDGCPRLSMLGGDEVINARLREDPPWEIFPELTLSYAVAGGGLALRENSEGRVLRHVYRETYGDDATLMDNGHFQLGWDALRYLSRAVDQAWAGTGEPVAAGRNERLTPATVQAVLYQGVSAEGFNGASGWIDARAADGEGRVTEDRLITILRAEPGDDPWPEELVCGAVNSSDRRDHWGDQRQYDCP